MKKCDYRGFTSNRWQRWGCEVDLDGDRQADLTVHEASTKRYCYPVGTTILEKESGAGIAMGMWREFYVQAVETIVHLEIRFGVGSAEVW